MSVKKSGSLGLNRRDFLKVGALAAGGGILSATHGTRELVFGEPLPAEYVDKEVDGCCQFCQVRCTTKVQVKDGRVVNVYGNPDNYWTGGAMCPKGKSMVELTYRPERLLHPLIRTAGGWQRIAYREAVDRVAEKILAIKEEHPEDFAHRVALFAPLWESRESELAALAALHLAGFPDFCHSGDACVGNSGAAMGLVLGSARSPTPVDELPNAQLVVLFGANIAEMYPPLVRWISMARQRGVKVTYLDPRKTATTNFCDQQLMPRPGTDAALALGVIRHLIHEDRYDRAYVEAHVNGFDELAASAEPFTPEEVSRITWIPKEDVLSFAESYAQSNRTVVWLGGSMSRYTNSINSVRAVIALQAITGNLAGPGKGLMSVQGGKPGGEEEFDEHYKDHDLAGRLAVRKVLFGMKKGNVDLLLLNSSARRYPDANRVRKAIEKVGFVVYRGFFMDQEAELSHLIIPGTMTYESEGSQYGAQRQVVWRSRAVKRPGETVEDWRFYTDLGKRLNGDRFPDVNSAEDLFRLVQESSHSWKGLTLERLKESASGIMWPCPDPGQPERIGSLFEGDRFLTDDGKVQLVTPALGPITWKAPRGSPKFKPGKPDKFPLIFTQGKVVQHWQHTLTNWSALMGQFSGGNVVLAHPQTTGELDLQDGESVYIETEVGRLSARLHVTAAILPGVIWTPSHPAPGSPDEGNAGQPVNSVIPYYWDKIAAQFNGFGCRLVKPSRARE